MTQRKLLLVLGVVAGAVAVLALRDTDVSPQPAPTAAGPVAPSPAAPLVGQTATLRRYAVTLESDSALGGSADAPVGGRLLLAGDVDVAFDGPWARLSFGEPRRLEMTLMGQDVTQRVRAALASGHARVALDAQGHHGAVTLSAGADPLLGHVARLLAPELLVGVPAGDGVASVVDQTTQGAGTATVARAGQALSRQRVYTQLTAARSLGLDVAAATVVSRWSGTLSGAHVATLSAEESITVMGWRSHLAVNAAPASSAPEPVLTAGDYVPAPTDAQPMLRAARLAERAAQLTPAVLSATVASFRAEQATGQPHAAFLRQGAALLASSPEAVKQLERGWQHTSEAGRDLGLDLLAHAGSEPAQAAAVRLVDAELAAGSPHAVTRLQRLAMMRAPGAAALGLFRRQLYGATELGVRRGAALTLGAAADQLARAGDTAAADAVAEELERLLPKAEAALRPAVIAALGNAARPRSIAALADTAQDPDSAARWATARAVRNMPIHPRWRELLNDSSARVQHAAIESLGRGEAGVAMIMEAVVANAIQAQNYGEVYTLLQRRSHAGQVAGVADTLAAMTTHPQLRPELAARLRELRAEVSDATASAGVTP